MLDSTPTYPLPPQLKTQGACNDPKAETAWFFSNNPRDYGKAKAICATCPVFDICDEFASLTGQWGIWAGRNRQSLASPPDLIGVTWCPGCSSFFEFERKPGRHPATCSPECAERQTIAVKRKSDAKRNRIVNPGVMREVYGHGVISRYQTGCRCKMCRHAAKIERRRYRKAVSV